MDLKRLGGSPLSFGGVTAKGEWLEVQADRAAARQRSQVDTAKVLVTFSAGIAATLVATALQVGDPSKRDIAAAVVLGLSMALVMAVLKKDRLTEADQDSILSQGAALTWSDARLVGELRAAQLAAVRSNESTVTDVDKWAKVALSVAGASAAMSAWSLLWP